MAALKHKEEHNKVGYLLKPTKSDDYHQIINFLGASHIRYALNTNPIIFDSLVKQFWSTVTLRAPELGPPAILATIDKTPYTITKELVRSRLQLADDGGIADLPIPGMVSNIGNAKKILMYPRFLQTILGIETRVTRQYTVMAFTSKLFANMRLNFARHPMPLLPAMLLQDQAGGGAEVAEQVVPHPMPAPDQSLAHLPTPSRPQTSDPVASGLEHDHSPDPNETAAGSFPNREDAPLGDDFHTSPPRSSHAPFAGQPSRGMEDPITLTAFSFVVSTLMQKVHSLEVKLHDHKKLFKDVVGNPSVPTAGPPDTSGIPPATFAIPPGAFDAPTGTSTVLPGASNVSAATLVIPADSPNVLAAVPSDSPTILLMEDDRLGEEAAKWLHGKEMAQMERERAEAQRKRQHDVLDSAMYYNESDWLNIRAQVEANASLSKTLLGDNVTKENFPARMAALIEKKRQALAEQLFKESLTLKRPGPVLEEPSTKRLKSPEAPTPSIPETFLKVVVDEYSYDEDFVDEVWSTVVGWEDLMKLYGLVVQYYVHHPAAGAGLLFWGDLQIVSGEVLSMFTDVYYPLSVKLMERMLMHKLEIDSDFMGNDLTTAEQLIQFIENQIVAPQASFV
nr:xylulose kinase-1 [Tanacetum cinerariifolium]